MFGLNVVCVVHVLMCPMPFLHSFFGCLGRVFAGRVCMLDTSFISYLI